MPQAAFYFSDTCQALRPICPSDGTTDSSAKHFAFNGPVAKVFRSDQAFARRTRNPGRNGRYADHGLKPRLALDILRPSAVFYLQFADGREPASSCFRPDIGGWHRPAGPK
jgi:hypothetical protein